MDLTPTVRSLLYTVKLKQPPAAIDFDSVKWQANSGFRNRYTAHKADNELSALIKHISNQQHTLLDTLWSDDYFRLHLWAGTSLEQLKQHTSPFVELCKDMPGFATSVHVDHRRAVTTGMVFFNSESIPEQNTVFYADEKGTQPMPMTSAWAQGWYTANTHLSWHKGTNASEQVRYSLKFGLYLSMPSG
jgi:hypothetical protein